MSCKIVLGRSDGFFAGSTIKGQVEYYPGPAAEEEKLIFSSVKIWLECKEHIAWRKNKKIFSKNNVVLGEELNLLTAELTKTKQGVYLFPFSFILPYEIPSSFKGEYGYVRYRLVTGVKLSHPWRSDGQKENILVYSPIIFNTTSPHFPERVTYSNEKKICFCCWSHGELGLEVQLPTTAFATGEIIPLTVYLGNLTSSNVDDLKVRLQEILIFGSSFSKRIIKEEIASITEDGLGGFRDYCYDLSLKIPENYSVPNFTRCRYFRVEYKLKVYCRMFNGLTKLALDIPGIQIGHLKVDPNLVAQDHAEIFPSPKGYQVMMPLY